MNGKQISIGHRARAAGYTVHVTSGQLNSAGKWARECLGTNATKAIVVSNPTVFAHYGDRLVRSLKAAGFQTASWLMNDGERFKDLRSTEAALKYFASEGLTRDDAVVALGGGVVGDLAGFAAAIHLRGIRFLQIPTTLLAMIDSSVGGKTGVNAASGKNMIGAFHQPSGVLVDVETLATLPKREMTSGFCEAVKHGAVAGRPLFDQTAEYLDRFPPGRSAPASDEFIQLIIKQIAFKASIVRQDETENTARADSRSRKVLNFGHTFGHALEKVTNYRRFRHGEAVGQGIIFAAELSKNLEILGQNEVKLLNDVVHRAGRLPSIPDVGPREFLEALKFDKKLTGGHIQWVLLRGIGKPLIVSETDIPRRAITAAVKKIIKN
jgi:3-dehydroquinate synthase